MKQVLIIEDDAFIRDLLSEKLTQSHFSIDIADSGEAALEVVAEKRYDLLVLDLELSDMSGIDVLKQLKSSEATAALPVIIFSNNDDPDVKASCLGYGAVDFFVKIDTDLNKLVERINEVVSHETI